MIIAFGCATGDGSVSRSRSIPFPGMPLPVVAPGHDMADPAAVGYAHMFRHPHQPGRAYHPQFENSRAEAAAEPTTPGFCCLLNGMRFKRINAFLRSILLHILSDSRIDAAAHTVHDRTSKDPRSTLLIAQTAFFGSVKPASCPARGRGTK